MLLLVYIGYLMTSLYTHIVMKKTKRLKVTTSNTI